MKKLMLVVLISNLAILTACKEKTPEEKYQIANEKLNAYHMKFMNNPEKIDKNKANELEKQRQEAYMETKEYLVKHCPFEQSAYERSGEKMSQKCQEYYKSNK